MSGGGGCCAVCKIAKLLAGIGALNWGLVALFQLDLVARLLGEMSGASKVVYILIGVAGLLTLLSFAKVCPCCKQGSCEKK